MSQDEFTSTKPSDRSARTAHYPAALLVSELFPPAVGGTPVLFDEVYSRLDFDVVVLTDGAARVGQTELGSGGITVVRRPIASRNWGVLDPTGLSHHWRLRREIRRLAAGRRAIVHCGRSLPEGVAAWFNRRLGGPRYICWSHGEDIGTARQSREFTLLMRRVCLGAAAHLVNSCNTGRMLEDLGVPAARIHVAYPGVDALRFRPDVDGSALRARHAPGAGLVLLSVGRLQRRKGHDLTIQAIARLESGPPVTYLIAGEGEERPRLEALVASLHLQDRVRFLGEVAADDLPRFYAACDVFVLPNRVDQGDIEGFGIVFLEAAATGRPAIGGNSGGAPEAIVDGETGLLVSGTDVDELAAAIRTLATSTDTRHGMGAAGRARVCRDFTWEQAAAKVGAVHHEVAAMGPGSRWR